MRLKKIATDSIINSLFTMVVMKIYCHALLFTVVSERVKTVKGLIETLRTSIKKTWCREFKERLEQAFC